MDCWEFMGCKEDARRLCPAYPDHGGDCWTLPTTVAAGGHLDMETHQAKTSYCKEHCGFYKITVSFHRPSPGV